MKKERKKSKEWAVRSIYLFIVAISLPSSRTPSEQSSEEINDNANRNSEKRNSSLLFFNKKSFDCSPNKVEEGEEPAEGETLPKQRQRCKRDLWMILFIWYVFPRSLSTAHCSNVPGSIMRGRFGRNEDLKRKWINFKPHETHCENPDSSRLRPWPQNHFSLANYQFR